MVEGSYPYNEDPSQTTRRGGGDTATEEEAGEPFDGDADVTTIEMGLASLPGGPCSTGSPAKCSEVPESFRFSEKIEFATVQPPLKSNLGVKEKLTGGGEEKKTPLVQADIHGVLGACGGEEIYHPSGITGFQSRVEKRESEEEFFSGIESLQSSDEEERMLFRDKKGVGDMKQGHGERVTDPLNIAIGTLTKKERAQSAIKGLMEGQTKSTIKDTVENTNKGTKQSKGAKEDSPDYTHMLSDFFNPIERSLILPEPLISDKSSQQPSLLDLSKGIVSKGVVSAGVTTSKEKMESHIKEAHSVFSYAKVLRGSRQGKDSLSHSKKGPHDQDDSADVTNKTKLGKTSVGGWKHVENNLPRRTINYDFERLLDDKLLETYFEEFGDGQDDSYDPRQRYVTCFRYRGADPQKLEESYMLDTVLFSFLKIPQEDILAVIMPQGMRETDVCLVSEAAFQKFWARVRVATKAHLGPLQEFDLVPLFQKEARVLTISLRTTTIPEEDIERWLQNRCSTAGSAEVFLLEVKMWTKMILSLSAEELEHLIKNLRTKYLELQMMERDLQTDFDALCQDKSISLSTQEGQNIRKNYEKEQRRLEYKLKTIRTRLAHCTYEADKRREKMDRESEEQDRGREKDNDDGETERDEVIEGKEKKDTKRGGERGGKRGKKAECREGTVDTSERDTERG
ncbi:UNVERIFIED_CONTAM: hypothetical protein K2H54_056772 [Gekko kuhli]